MKKLYFLLATLFCGVTLSAYLYFSKLNANTGSNEMALNQITEKSALVFCFDNDKSFYEILQKQDLLGNLLGEHKSKVFANLAKLVSTNKYGNQLRGTKINIGFVPNGDKVDFIINMQLKKAVRLDDLTDTAFSLKKADSACQIDFKDGSICYAIAAQKVVSISNNKMQLNTAKNKTLNAFTKYIVDNSKKNKNALANLYIDFYKINNLIKSVITTKITGELEMLNKQKIFASLGYNFGTEKILFNGYTSVLSDSSYYHLFTTEKTQKMTIDAILPETTANYTFYGIDKYGAWSENLDHFLLIKNVLEKKEKEKQYVSANFGVKLDQIFPKYFKNEMIAFQLSTGEKFGAIALTNGDKTEQLLMDLSAFYAPEIQIFKRPNLLYYYFGEVFKKFERPFYTIIDNYLIFANNAVSIQSFLSAYKNGKLLIETDNYKKFANRLSSSATITFYVNANNSTEIFNRQLKNEYFRQFQSINGFKDYNAFCYQLSADNKKFVANMLILKKTNN